MFIAWQRVALGATGTYERDDCPHPVKAVGREAMRPVVREAFRVDGKPRNRVIARPGDSVRRCCLADRNPIAIGRFWLSVKRRAHEATLRIGLAREVYTRAEEALWRDKTGWLFDELAKTVPELTADEECLYDLFERDEPLPAGATGRGFAARLEAARARVEAYQKTKRRSEQADEWWLRVEPPPGYDKKAAERKRDAAHALWAEAFRRLHGDHFADFRARRQRTLERVEAAIVSSEAAAVLGLRWPCTALELKAAWRRTAKTAHPDQGGTVEAFRAAKAAHEVLAAALDLA